MKTKSTPDLFFFSNVVKKSSCPFALNYLAIHTWYKYAMTIMTLFLTSIVLGQTALVNPPTGGFNIDGTLKAETEIGDWVEGTGTGGYLLENNAGTWEAVNSDITKFVRDEYNAQSDLSFTGGSSFGDNPNNWKWSTGKPTSKCDINTALLHATTSATEKWIILGGDRFTTTGTSYIDFEFSQGIFSREDDGTFSSVAADGITSLSDHNGRTPGDFVLSMEYSNGGTNATVHYYVWEQVGSSYKYVEKPIPGGAGINYAFGATNGSAADVPYGAFGSNSYMPYAFVEAAVNIDAILAASCLSANIKTVFVKTKASDSYSAALKDFVEPQPVNFVFGQAGLSYNGPFCKTSTISPTIPAIPSGTFSATPVGLSINSTTGAINLANSTVGTYTVTYTPTGGVCLNPSNDKVIINPLPTPADANIIICTDEISTDLTSYDITVLNGETGTVAWYDGDPDNVGSSIASPGIANLNNLTDLWAEVTLTATGCKAKIDITLTINPLPTPADAPFTLCADEISTDLTSHDTTVLDGETGTVAWYDGDPGNGGSSIASPETANLNNVTDLWAEVILTGTGCKAYADVTVTINPLPTPADANIVICADEISTDLNTYYTTVLDGETGTVAWYDGDPGSGGALIDPDNAVDLNNVANLWAEVTLTGTGCKAKIDVTLTINPLPTPADANIVICADETSTDLNTYDTRVLDGETGTVAWYDGDPGSGGALIDPDNAVDLNNVANLLAEVTLTGTGCKAKIDVTVTINPLPSTPLASVTQPTCGVATGTISVTSGTTGLTFSINSTNPIDFTNNTGIFSSLGAGIYSVRAKNVNGCISNPVQKQIFPAANAPNTPVVNVVQAATCSSAQIILQVASPLDAGGDDYEYNNSNVDANWQDEVQFTINAGDGFNIRARRKDDLTCVSDTVSCPEPEEVAPSSAKTTTKIESSEALIISNETTVKVYPNPFNNNVSFKVNASSASEGNLELVNMMGQKVKTVFNGKLNAGVNTFDVSLPSMKSSVLLYVLQVGNKRITGKLIQSK